MARADLDQEADQDRDAGDRRGVERAEREVGGCAQEGRAGHRLRADQAVAKHAHGLALAERGVDRQRRAERIQRIDHRDPFAAHAFVDRALQHGIVAAHHHQVQGAAHQLLEAQPGQLPVADMGGKQDAATAAGHRGSQHVMVAVGKGEISRPPRRQKAVAEDAAEAGEVAQHKQRVDEDAGMRTQVAPIGEAAVLGASAGSHEAGRNQVAADPGPSGADHWQQEGAGGEQPAAAKGASAPADGPSGDNYCGGVRSVHGLSVYAPRPATNRGMPPAHAFLTFYDAPQRTICLSGPLSAPGPAYAAPRL